MTDTELSTFMSKFKSWMSAGMRAQFIVNWEHRRAQVNLQVNLEPADAVDHPQEEQHHRQAWVAGPARLRRRGRRAK